MKKSVMLSSLGLLKNLPSILKTQAACQLHKASAVCSQGDLLPSLVDCAQGGKVAHFSSAEMESRLSKLRAYMAKENIDTCVFTSYHNICYYSEFLYCSFGRPYGLVVNHDTQTSVSAKIDYGQPWRKTYGDNIVFTDWQRDNFYRALQKLVGDSKSVGVELDVMNVFAHKKLQESLPSATFSDVGVPTMQMRMIKSTEEIDLIKNSANIGDIGGQTVTGVLEENIPEHEVALASTRAMVREIANRYPNADIMDTWTWFQSGINTDGAHNPVTTRKVQKGDILSLNCFPMINGYYTALERTMFLDHASDAHLKYWNVNVEVHEAGAKLIKPGMKCSDIAKELNTIYERHCLLQHRSFGYGHSFGVLCHYYGREAGLELREDIDTVLEPNMVVSMEPMITIPEGMPGSGGYREHDIFVVKEDGAENITGFPYGPEHNIIKK